MKRKLTGICCLLILFGGIALLIAGIVVGNTSLLFAGIGITFGGGFVCAVVAFILKCLRVHDRRKDPAVEEDYVPEDERMMAAVADNWNLSSHGDKIKGILFVGCFIASCVLFVVFSAIGKMTWAFVSWGCGMGMMLVAFAVVKIKERFSSKCMTDGRFFETEATVLSCELMFEDRAKGRSMYHATVDVAGKQVKCTCFRPYETGQSVVILHDKKTDYTMIKE